MDFQNFGLFLVLSFRWKVTGCLSVLIFFLTVFVLFLFFYFAKSDVELLELWSFSSLGGLEALRRTRFIRNSIIKSQACSYIIDQKNNSLPATRAFLLVFLPPLFIPWSPFPSASWKQGCFRLSRTSRIKGRTVFHCGAVFGSTSEARWEVRSLFLSWDSAVETDRIRRNSVKRSIQRDHIDHETSAVLFLVLECISDRWVAPLDRNASRLHPQGLRIEKRP